MDSFQPLTAHPIRISSRIAEPPGRICWTYEKYGSSSPVGFVRPSAGRDDVSVGPGRAGHHDVAQRKRHQPKPGTPERRTSKSRKCRHVVMRLEQLGREFMALADLRPVVLVDGTLRHGFVLRLVCRQIPAGRSRRDVGLVRLAPALDQTSFMFAIYFSSSAGACGASVTGVPPAPDT